MISADSNGHVSQPRGRPSDEGRFVWQATAAIERIVNRLGMTQAAYGVAVYVALCRMSSAAKGNPQITASIYEIAGKARLGYRKTFEILHALAGEQIGVIAIEERRTAGRKTQEPSTYTLKATRLHDGKSGRLRNRKSDQTARHAAGPDCAGRTTSHAEIPIELPKAVVEKGLAAPALAAVAQPGAPTFMGGEW